MVHSMLWSYLFKTIFSILLQTINRIRAVACEYAPVFLTVCVCSQTPQGRSASGYGSSEAANGKNMLGSGFEKGPVM